MSKSSSGARALRLLVAVCATIMVSLGWSATASAHTEFVSSTPAEGATVDGPLSTVTIEFTNPAVEAGEGFALLEPSGNVRVPESLDPTDGTAFIATFDPPLEAGEYGFRWQVQAGDAHPIDGSFKFTVTGGAPSASTAAPAATEAPPTAAPATAAPITTSTPEALAGASPTSIATEPQSADTPTTTTATLDEFLTTNAGPGPTAGRIARAITMASTIFAAGVIAALVLFVQASRDEIEHLLSWVRLAGLGLITGGVIGFAALDEVQASSRATLATSKPGIAVLLSIVGGVCVFVGFRPGVGAIAAPPRSLSAAVTVERRTRALPGTAGVSDDRARWTLDANASVGLAGLAVTLAAYMFDGHTVSRGPWLLHGAVDLVHVGSASIWVGGVFTIALLAGMRRHRNNATGLAAMIIRFSSVAAISLTALSVAGAAMAVMIAGSPGAVFSSSWGKILAIKIGAVAVAAAVGGYNHFALRPKLAAHPDDPEIASHLRVSLAIESAVMVAVIVLTAVLVASAT